MSRPPLATWCEIARPGVCQGRAVHRHHVILRGRKGSDAGPRLDVCAACHDFAHLHRDVARAHGWIIDGKSGAA